MKKSRDGGSCPGEIDWTETKQNTIFVPLGKETITSSLGHLQNAELLVPEMQFHGAEVGSPQEKGQDGWATSPSSNIITTKEAN